MKISIFLTALLLFTIAGTGYAQIGFTHIDGDGTVTAITERVDSLGNVIGQDTLQLDSEQTTSIFPSTISDFRKENYIEAKIEAVGGFTKGGNAPFWFTNNNYGIGSIEKNSQYLRAGIFVNKDLIQINDKKLWINVGADVIVANNFQSDYYFHQLFVDFDYRALKLSIGAKERKSEYLNDALSSGNLTHSINNRPIPQVEIGFPNYETVPFTNGLLHIKGGLSYGWFTDDGYKRTHAYDGDYALNVLYHRKYAYFKFDNGHLFNFTLGLDMGAQFSGDMYKNFKYYQSSPHKLSDYFKVLIPSAGGKDANSTDIVNIIGNMYGSWHFLANYKINAQYEIKGYYDHYFDDHSGMWFKNMPDGLWGIEWSLHNFKPVTNIVFEYVHTKNQSGPFLWDKTGEIPVQVSGGDDYYNSVDYISLSNYGMVLGSPFIISPIYSHGKTLWIKNNRISAFHGGISGYICSELQYRALCSYSKSWGTYSNPSIKIKNQFSCMAEVNYTPQRLTGWAFSMAVANDNSDLVGDNTGIRIKISKTLNSNR